MKKLLFLVLLIGIFLVSGYFYGFKNLFIPSVIKKVKGPRIEALKKEALLAEDEFKKNLSSADRAEKAGYSYEKLGESYLQNKDWTPAIESLEKAVEYGRSGARVHHALGVAYANRGKDLGNDEDINKAEVHYKRAIEKNPRMMDSVYGLAVLNFYVKNDRETAISLLKSIRVADPKYYDASFALAKMYYENGDPAASLAAYEELYAVLSKEKESPRIKEYRNNCKENITRLMMELSGSKR